jgi:hypothetical protein
MHKLTFCLLVLVLSTLGVSVLRHRNTILQAIVRQKDADHYKRISERFPTADYNEQNVLDPENARKREKKKRYNDGKLVFSSPQPWLLESVFTPEPHLDFPSLPVSESDIVVVGTVGTGAAHLSENKRNVFSEFTLIVEDILKSRISGIVQGSVLTIDRIGGHVKYPNGQKVLFRVAGMNMPQSGARYLLFLTSKHNKEDLSIVTGYELTDSGAIPLDELPQVASLTGVAEADILQRVRSVIRNSSQ